MKILIDIESAIDRFGKWIASFFDAAQKVYNRMTEAEKAAAAWAYGVIAIVNNNLDKEAGQIIKIIQLKYPDLSLDVIHGFLEIVLNDIKVVQGDIPLSLEDAIETLAKYLGSLKGDAWKTISQTLGSLLSVLLSPTTPVQKFVAVAELVYQGFVKAHIAD